MTVENVQLTVDIYGIGFADSLFLDCIEAGADSDYPKTAAFPLKYNQNPPRSGTLTVNSQLYTVNCKKEDIWS